MERMTSGSTTELNVAHIRLLSEQINATYIATRTERRTLAQWEESQPFSILGVLELFSSDIQGYVESLSTDQPLTEADSILSHLSRLNAFQVDYFARWYFESWSAYPKIRLYVEQLDHLRLLLVEHIRNEASVAA